MTGKAYIFGALNGAITVKDNTCDFVDGNTLLETKLDGYLYSQIRAINPERRNIFYETEAELFEKIFVESVQQRALNQALELMDPKFSAVYRGKVASKLIEKLKIHDGLIDFLTNRLYSTSLPDQFKPGLALEEIARKSDPLHEIYSDLEEKTALFDRFYTLLRIKLNLNEKQQQEIDFILADKSAFSNFALALYQKSNALYQYSANLAIQSAGKLNDKINDSLFLEIKRDLERKYKIFLKENKKFNYCESGQINIVRPHRFFGSSLKTIFQFYNEGIPLTSAQFVNILFNNLPFEKASEESLKQFECRLYDNTLNEIRFLSAIKDSPDLYTASNEVLANELISELGSGTSADHFHRHRNLRIDLAKESTYSAVLFADCIFLTSRYNDASLIYMDILPSIKSVMSKNSDLVNIFIYAVTSIKLAISLYLIGQTEEASRHIRSAYGELTSHPPLTENRLNLEVSQSNKNSRPVGDEYVFPETSHYITALSESVNDLFISNVSWHEHVVPVSSALAAVSSPLATVAGFHGRGRSTPRKRR